jgi:hypothetical protein
VTANALLALCLFAPAQPSVRAQSTLGSPDLVISQIYTRGGEPGALFQNDFVEIFNRGSSDVDMNGWGLNIRTSDAVASAVLVRFSSNISLPVAPGRYALVKLSGGTDGQPLPLTFFDLSLSPIPISLSGAGGEVALLRPNGSIPFFGCPTAQSAGVADYVGYGTGITCFEGTAAPAPTLTTALLRMGGGCTDVDNNLLDFRVGVPNPRSFSTAAAPCSATTPASVLNFAAPQFDTFEGAGRAQISVTRTGDTSTPASVDYATSDGTASERGDYTTAAGTLQFAPGETQKSFDVLVTDDAFAETNETVGLTLSNAKGGASLGTRPAATLVIHDNDFSAGTNPVDGSAFFAQQNYYDFLSRLPDSSGLQFWTNGIESCGADAQCRAVKRVDTSAAFFLSIEFQETGFLVYRLYKAALPETPARPRALPRYREFIRDTQAVARGVVVGADGWQQKLAANTLALLDDFVARPEFLSVYPAQLSPAEFVDKLNAQAGGPLSLSERDALVAGMNAGTETRASALRRVAEDADFKAAETNRAFVLMQYFGYLRRNPDDPPDASFAGYDFWLSKLDEFHGNYAAAEMVKAFITSTEYRARFGP